MKSFFNIVCLFLILSIDNIYSQKIHNQLTIGDPEIVGMSSERLERIDKVIKQYVENKWMPGAVAIIARKGTVVYYKGFGYRDIENNDPVQIDDIYRIASMTKAITSVGLMMLYEQGDFLLDDPISKYIPEFKNPVVLEKFNPKNSTYKVRPAKREITIRDLLTHTAGIPYNQPESFKKIYEKEGILDGLHTSNITLKDNILKLAKLPLLHDPGEKFTYGMNTDILGYLIEVLTDMSLKDYLQQNIFDPLGMKDTYFNLPESKKDRLAVVYRNDRENKLVKNAETGYDYPIANNKYFAGGAGLSSTVYDYAIFMQMLLNDGWYNNMQFLSRKTIDLMTTNQIGDLRGKESFGLGFALTTEKNFPKKPSSVGNYFWGGFFSTSYWIDPKEEIVAVFYTQMQPFKHSDIHDKFQILVYQAITD